MFSCVAAALAVLRREGADDGDALKALSACQQILCSEAWDASDRRLGHAVASLCGMVARSAVTRRSWTSNPPLMRVVRWFFYGSSDFEREPPYGVLLPLLALADTLSLSSAEVWGRAVIAELCNGLVLSHSYRNILIEAALPTSDWQAGVQVIVSLPDRIGNWLRGSEVPSGLQTSNYHILLCIGLFEGLTDGRIAVSTGGSLVAKLVRCVRPSTLARAWALHRYQLWSVTGNAGSLPAPSLYGLLPPEAVVKIVSTILTDKTPLPAEVRLPGLSETDLRAARLYSLLGSPNCVPAGTLTALAAVLTNVALPALVCRAVCRYLQSAYSFAIRSLAASSPECVAHFNRVFAFERLASYWSRPSFVGDLETALQTSVTRVLHFAVEHAPLTLLQPESSGSQASFSVLEGVQVRLV